MSYSNKTDPLIGYFKDKEKMKTNLKRLVDKEKYSSDFVLINLFQKFGIGKEIAKHGKDG